MRTRRCEAQALLEFALLAPLMLLMAAAVWDGGSTLRDQIALNDAARAGARAAAASAPDAGIPLEAMARGAAYGSLGLGEPADDAPDVSVDVDGSLVRVQLSSFRPLYTPILRQLWGYEGYVLLQASATYYLPVPRSTALPVVPSTPTPTPTPRPRPTPKHSETETPSPTGQATCQVACTHS